MHRKAVSICGLSLESGKEQETGQKPTESSSVQAEGNRAANTENILRHDRLRVRRTAASRFSLIRPGTCDKCHNRRVLNDFLKRWVIEQFLLQGGIVTHTSPSKRASAQRASTKCWNIFFSSKYDKYRVWQVLKPTSGEVWLSEKIHLKTLSVIGN